MNKILMSPKIRIIETVEFLRINHTAKPKRGAMKKLFLIIFLFNLQYTSGQIISTFAGNGIAGYGGDGGIATNAQLNYVAGVAFDSHENLFICDGNNRIRKVDTTGIITTFAGTGIAGFSGDNGLAINASIDNPHDIAFDAVGNLYISDFFNHRIRKVDTTGVITTYAGMGNAGVNGDSGLATAAALGYPDGIAIDAIGNLYVSEGNHACVRRIDTAGIITTIAGVADSTTYNGDGIQATSAHLNFPSDIAIDSIGNIFISEHFGGRIRKIDGSGIIQTIAGTGVSGYNGDNMPAVTAQLNHPLGLAFDLQWNLFIAESYNNRIRKIDNSGIITTIAGIGIAGFSGDGGLATMAKLDYPYMLTFDAKGNMFIADNFNYRVREVQSINVNILNIYQNNTEIKIFPNPTTDLIFIDNISSADNSTYEIYNGIGKLVKSGNTSEKYIQTNNLRNGIYFIRLIKDNGIIFGKFIKD